MDNTPVNNTNNNMKKFLILIVAAVVIVAAVAVGIFFATRGNGGNGSDVPPADHTSDPTDPNGDYTYLY